MKRKVIEKHGKQVVESIALIKHHDYDTKKDSSELVKQKEIFNKLVNESVMKY